MPCQGKDGVSVCTANGRCGSHVIKCASFIDCLNGGAPAGDSRQLCYCDCHGTNHSGPVCGDAEPQRVECSVSLVGAPPSSSSSSSSFASSATIVSVPVAANNNDRYLKVRLCASPDHACSGSAPAGSAKAYVNCHEFLPPRQAATLQVPESTTLIVFVDKHCPNIDYEVWKPAGPNGWAGLKEPIVVPSQCVGGAPPSPFSAGFPVSFPIGCGSDGGDYFPSRICTARGLNLYNGVCQFSDPGQPPRRFPTDYQAGVLRQCTASDCCKKAMASTGIASHTVSQKTAAHAPHTATRTTAPRNPNLKHLLFYTCVTPQVGNQCEEGFTADQIGIATTGVSSNFTTIEAGRAHNISFLFAVHDTFFLNGKGLRPDWNAAWAALLAKLVPLIETRVVVVGFFIGDELFPGKISLADFMSCLGALAAAKATYPWLITWENEGGLNWVADFKKNGVPAELDVISLDDYYMGTTPSSEAAGHRKFYEDEIYPLLKPHQKVFLVPGSFATHDANNTRGGKAYPKGNATFCYGGTFHGCDEYMADQANAFAQWAQEDPRVAGIAPWHWDSRLLGVVSPYKEVGVVDMPLTRAAWQGIGQAIRKGVRSGAP